MEKKFFIEEVVRELNERGYFAQGVEVNKNGVPFNGVTVGEGTVRPNIYLDSFFEEGLSVNETVEKIIEIAESHKLNEEDTERMLSIIKDKAYCLDNVKIVCSKANTYPNHINRLENGITLTMAIELDNVTDGKATVRVTPQLLNALDVSEDEMWNAAKENSEKDVVVEGMFETLVEMRGHDFFVPQEEDTMLVVTNNSKCNGAYAVFTDTAKAEIKKRMDVDEVIIIPSSIHECIVVPHTDEMNMDVVANIVKEVNATQVADEDILSDTPIALAI